MNDILKFNTINFKKDYTGNHNIIKEYLSIKTEIIFKYPSMDFNLPQFYDKKIPIYFVYDRNDNLSSKDIRIEEFDFNRIYNEKLQIVELVDHDIFIYQSISEQYFSSIYIFHINLERNEYLRKKIYSHDYKLFIFFDNYQFIIKLVFSPNMRKYKLQKLNDETDK